MSVIRVTIWNENIHEQQLDSLPAKIYPDGMHGAISNLLIGELGSNVEIQTATLDQDEHGLSQQVVDSTDVLMWWGHEAHPQVDDEVVERVYRAVLGGMGLIVLHSAHYSKIFKKLMGTTCSLRWRSAQDRELVWTINPTHPIAKDVPSPISISQQEMYGEYFDIPIPDELIFISSFSGGEVFRSGATWQRGLGKVFYFSPGDQDFPVYHQPEIGKVLANGVQWASPSVRTEPIDATFHPVGWFEGN
jgi:trehalose utilization protein